MIRRTILSIVVAMATASASAPSAFGSDSGQAADRVLSAGRVIKVDAEGVDHDRAQADPAPLHGTHDHDLPGQGPGDAHGIDPGRQDSIQSGTRQ